MAGPWLLSLVSCAGVRRLDWGASPPRTSPLQPPGCRHGGRTGTARPGDRRAARPVRTLPQGTFHLVYACYFHSPIPLDRDRILRNAAERVRTGGCLVLIDHGSAAPWSWRPGGGEPESPTPDRNKSGTVRARTVVWAGGEFHEPLLGGFPRASLADHSSAAAAWEPRGGELVVIGGYESGVELACHHAEGGASVTVVDPGHPWDDGTAGSDLSYNLAPRTRQRLARARAAGYLTFLAGGPVKRRRRTASESSSSRRASGVSGRNPGRSSPPAMARPRTRIPVLRPPPGRMARADRRR